MKKLSLLFLLPILIFSCSSDDNEEMKNDYNGTLWERKTYDKQEIYYWTYTLSFTSNNECGLTSKAVDSKDNIVIYFIDNYTYKVSKQDQLILTPKIVNNDSYIGSIDQNTMILLYENTNTEYMKLIKKELPS